MQRVPRSTGDFAKSAAAAIASAVIPSVDAKFSMNDPHPDEHASLSMTVSTVPSLRRMHFMSCPPMSRTQSACGSKNDAAAAWVTVSTSPPSSLKAAFMSSSPYPVETARLMRAPSGMAA